MGGGLKAKRGRRRSKAARASSSGGSGLSKQGHVFCCAAVSLVPPASYAVAAGKGTQAASASEEAGDYSLPGLSGPRALGRQAAPASEEGKILKHESEEAGDKILVEAAAAASEEGKILLHVSDEDEEGDKILVEAASEEVNILKHESEEDEEGDKMLKLDSLVLEPEETLEDRHGRVLMLDSEEDCKILMMVKSEEGKILKVRKEYAAATEAALVAVSLKPAEPEPAGKNKKMKVVKTLVPLAYIALIKAMPCLVTTPEFSAPDSYYQSKEDLDISRAFKLINIKLQNYHQALIDQYDKFGFAVDEGEVTDDEDEDNMVKN